MSQMRRSVGPAVAIAAVSLAFTVAACGGSDSGGGASASGGGKSTKPIKVGFAVDQTGLYSFAGVPSKQGATLAADEINAAGGINGRKIELVDGDAGSDQQQTKSLMTKYAADPSFMAVLGPSGSAIAPAVAPVVNAMKIPAIGPTVSSPVYTDNNDWTFKMGANPDGVGTKLCDVVKQAGLKKIAIMVTRDNVGQVGYKDTAVKCLPGAGATVVTVQQASDATDDYSSFISNIKSKNPDGIFTLLSGQRSAQFEVQARAAGIPSTVGFYGPNTVTGADFMKIGKQDVEGTVGVTEYFPGTENATNKAFVAAYTAKYDAPPDNYAAQGYASLKLLEAGIKASGDNVTRESIRDGMMKVADADTVMGDGKLTITPEHVSQYNLLTVQVKDGKLVLYKGPST
jgi:branched-chain amino acid transport system substrate-binding protein